MRIKIEVMRAKLTLKIDKSTIEKAKEYARKKDTSLSKMIENYLQALTNKQEEDDEISPLVKSLTGVIKPIDFDYKKNYSGYLADKYK